MSIKKKEEDIVMEFSMYEDWLEKYEYLIELGKDLPIIDDAFKTKDRLISGCQSQVWVQAENEDGKMRFTADSDAIITKGIIGLLIRVCDNEKPEDVAKCNFDFITAIGLQEHLSPTRSNGLLSMIKYMKTNALKMLK